MAKKPTEENNNKHDHPCCSFCGRSSNIVSMTTSDIDGSCICSDCAKYITESTYAMYQEQVENEAIQRMLDQIPTPVEIKKELDQYVIGQDDAKKTLAIAAYNHMKRIIQKSSGVEIEKSNCIVIGNTGCGKTALAKALARVMNLPYAIVDATAFTEAGYVGEDVESMLSRLLAAADYDVERAQCGVVFIDEVDKLSRKSAGASITRDVNGEGVQQAILKLVEGSKVNVPPYGGRKHPEKPVIEMDTKNILFICMGAFDNLEQKVEHRLSSSTVGYKTNSNSIVDYDKDNILKYANQDDLRSYGMIPELIGRLPIMTYVSPLDTDAMVKILTEPKNAIIKQYIKLFDMDGINLSFEPAALKLIAEKAVECKTGARALRSITETVIKDYMFRMPSEKKKHKKLVVTADYVKEQLDNAPSLIKKAV